MVNQDSMQEEQDLNSQLFDVEIARLDVATLLRALNKMMQSYLLPANLHLVFGRFG